MALQGRMTVSKHSKRLYWPCSCGNVIGHGIGLMRRPRQKVAHIGTSRVYTQAGPQDATLPIDAQAKTLPV